MKFMRLGIGLVLGLATLSGAQVVRAERYTSPNYTIDASVGNSFGGDSGSASYKLTSSGGESIVGGGQGGSYKLTQGYVAQLPRSLQLTVQPKGLVAYYPLDETEGATVFDESRYSYDGEFAVAPADPARATGKLNNGLDVDGDDYAEIPYSSDFDVTAQGMTWSAWVTADSLSSTFNMIMGKHLPYVDIRNTGKIHFSLYADGLQRNVYGSTTLQTGQWYYVAASYDAAGYMLVYVDGQEDGIAGPFINPSNYNYSFRIGHWSSSSSSYYFDGLIDEVKIFNRALSATEIEAEYDAGLAGNAAGLVFDDAIIAGTSRTAEAEAVIQTDAPGYNLTIQQSSNLTKGSDSIPALSGGTIGAPVGWSEGTTKGLGFSVSSASFGAVPAKWDSGNSYAALPASGTSFLTRSGYGGGGKDVVDLRYRVDVASGQPSGKYSNQVTYTGVMVP